MTKYIVKMKSECAVRIYGQDEVRTRFRYVISIYNDVIRIYDQIRSQNICQDEVRYVVKIYGQNIWIWIGYISNI